MENNILIEHRSYWDVCLQVIEASLSEGRQLRLFPVHVLPLHQQGSESPLEALQEEVRLPEARDQGGRRWRRWRVLQTPQPETSDQGHLHQLQVRHHHYEESQLSSPVHTMGTPSYVCY